MQPSVRVAVVAILATVGLSACTKPDPTTAVSAVEPRRQATLPPVISLSDAAQSPEELVDRFLDAVATGDSNAVEKLRVTEQEYRTFVLPGGVKTGESPRNFPATPSVYYWQLLDTKSRYALRSLLSNFGGRRYQRKDLTYRKGTRDYAWYRAYEKLSLSVEDPDGKQTEINTGSIIEVSGRYKFVSFYGG